MSIRTTKEHYELSVALKIPVVIVMTHIDLVSEDGLLAATEKMIVDLNLKRTMTVLGDEDLEECLNMLEEPTHSFSPIFFVSCVTGQNLDLLKLVCLVPTFLIYSSSTRCQLVANGGSNNTIPQKS